MGVGHLLNVSAPHNNGGILGDHHIRDCAGFQPDESKILVYISCRRQYHDALAAANI